MCVAIYNALHEDIFIRDSRLFAAWRGHTLGILDLEMAHTVLEEIRSTSQCIPRRTALMLLIKIKLSK